MSKFTAAVARAKKLYKTGRYKKFSDAVKAAYKKGPVKSSSSRKRKPARKIASVKRRVKRTTASKPAAAIGIRIGGNVTLVSLMSAARQKVKEKIDSAVIRKYHATKKRDKKKIQKQISLYNSQLRKLS